MVETPSMLLCLFKLIRSLQAMQRLDQFLKHPLPGLHTRLNTNGSRCVYFPFIFWHWIWVFLCKSLKRAGIFLIYSTIEGTKPGHLDRISQRGTKAFGPALWATWVAAIWLQETVTWAIIMHWFLHKDNRRWTGQKQMRCTKGKKNITTTAKGIKEAAETFMHLKTIFRCNRRWRNMWSPSCTQQGMLLSWSDRSYTHLTVTQGSQGAAQ